MNALSAQAGDAMTTIRNMTPEDADAVRRLDAEAFLPYMRQTGRGDSMPPRTRENVLSCLALNPGGCFVAQDGRRIVGHIFSRTWGQVGWIGVFGVEPARQGAGIGGRLLTRASENLKAAGCATIGLETMPDWPTNVGFYARHGFKPTFSVLTLSRAARRNNASPSVLLSELDTAEGLGIVSAISREALPGLDCALESRNAAEFQWGDTLLIGWPEPWAAAVVRTVPKRETRDDEPTADVSLIVGTPDARLRLSEILRALDAFAGHHGLKWLIVRVGGSDWQTLSALLEDGFAVSHIALRMMLRGEDAPAPGLFMSRWAM